MRLNLVRTCAMILCLVAFLAVSPRVLHATGIDLTLSPVSSAPGTTVTVDGTITNTGSTTIFLNNADFTLGSASFSNGDVTDFFFNAPFFLDAGDSSGFALFTFDIAGGTLGGTYTGNFLDILGGPGVSDQNLLASTEFDVTVTSSATVPEPSALPLAAMGLLSLLVLGWIKKMRLHAFDENRA
jgi:hypothetical protein